MSVDAGEDDEELHHNAAGEDEDGEDGEDGSHGHFGRVGALPRGANGYLQ